VDNTKSQYTDIGEILAIYRMHSI